MIDKERRSCAEAVADIADGALILIGGFGEAGSPTELIQAVLDQGARDLTLVNNNAGNGEIGIAALIRAGRVRRMICSFPRTSPCHAFAEAYRAGRIELELTPQGTLAERIRAGGAGIPAFYTPTSADTPLAQGKEVRMFAGRPHVLEHAIKGDFALIKAEAADRWGNLIYRKAARSFGPIMATAARTTVVQARRMAGLGELDPEAIVTPGIFVHRVVAVPHPVDEAAALAGLERFRG